MAGERLKYDAFISYRHSELDSFVSENLHKKLESFTLPKSVLRQMGTGKTKIERVFRDEAELPLSDNLSDPITEALIVSDFLIVICTPRLPQSEWCKKEIETFVKLHDRQHVLLVLAEGEPEESFPEILMYEDVKRKDENGNEVTIREEREPLAADCRADNDRDRLKALDNVVVKIAAAIFNLNYDDLKQRHRERKMRIRLIALSCATVIVTAFALTCLFFMIKIGRQNRIISDRYAGTMAQASDSLLSKGLRKDAVYAVRQVLPDNASKGYNPDAFRALAGALGCYETDSCYFPDNSFRVPSGVNGLLFSDDASKALVCGSEWSYLYDLDLLCETYRVESGNAIINDTGIVYMDKDFKAIYADPETGEEKVLKEDGIDLCYAKGLMTTLVFSLNDITAYKGSEEVYDISLDKYGELPEDAVMEDVFVTDDGRYAAFVISSFEDSVLGCINIADGELLMFDSIGDAEQPCVATDGNVVYLYTEEEDYFSSMQETAYLTAIDTGSKTTLAEAELPVAGFYSIIISEDGLLLVSDRVSCVFDEDLELLSQITGYTDACCAFACPPGFVILDRMGRVETYEVYSDDDRVYELYGHDENTFINFAEFYNDRFYIKYSDSDSVVIYAPHMTEAEVLSDIDDEISLDLSEKPVDTDKLEGIRDIDVFSAAASDDGKYILVSSYDVLYVYDAVEGKLIKEMNDPGIFIDRYAFPHFEKAGVYIAGNAVFDEDMNFIAMLPHAGVAAMGKDGKSLILPSGYSLDRYYNIPILSYEEMLKKADELIAGYKPDRRICDRYSIGYETGE
ncbi:MAG: TIR domain-containing protein [Lachnospiraceae bacterium]|nr:TIR domain-containing protein [Lachnospiraceae bacterium]